MLPFQTENGSQLIFLNLFTVCSSCQRRFVVCPFDYEETNGNYLFGNGLNGLSRLDNLCNSSPYFLFLLPSLPSFLFHLLSFFLSVSFQFLKVPFCGFFFFTGSSAFPPEGEAKYKMCAAKHLNFLSRLSVFLGSLDGMSLSWEAFWPTCLFFLIMKSHV